MATDVLPLAIYRFLHFRSKSIKIEQVDNHKELRDRLLSISDICRLISIEFNRQDRILLTIEIIDMFRPGSGVLGHSGQHL